MKTKEASKKIAQTNKCAAQIQTVVVETTNRMILSHAFSVQFPCYIIVLHSSHKASPSVQTGGLCFGGGFGPFGGLYSGPFGGFLPSSTSTFSVGGGLCGGGLYGGRFGPYGGFLPSSISTAGVGLCSGGGLCGGGL
jgi:hypothetical protein